MGDMVLHVGLIHHTRSKNTHVHMDENNLSHDEMDQ